MGMKTIFFGTPDFAVPALEALAASPYRPMLAVTRPDRPRGRGHKLTPCPVKSRALELGIEVAEPERLRGNADFTERVKTMAPDLIVVAAYGNILPNEVLDTPARGCVNIHASLLPKYRGAAPVHRAVQAGEKETGVSLMYMSAGLDEGDVIAASALDIGDMDTGRLQEELARLGASLLMEYMPLIKEGKAPGTPQDHSAATYARMVTKEEGHIDFSAGTDEVLNLIRAMTPIPGAYAIKEGQSWKIRRARAAAAEELSALSVDGDRRPKPGDIMKASSEGIMAITADGAVVIQEIQTPGKRPMDVSDYLRGHGIDKTEGFT